MQSNPLSGPQGHQPPQYGFFGGNNPQLPNHQQQLLAQQMMTNNPSADVTRPLALNFSNPVFQSNLGALAGNTF